MIERRDSRGWHFVSEVARWGTCFALVIGVHIGGALALLANWEKSDLAPNPPAILIDLAPVAAAPEEVQTDLPVGPQVTEAEPEPEPEKPVVEEPPPVSAVQLEPPKPPEKPKPKDKPKDKPKKERVKQTTAPQAAPKRAPEAASMSGAGSRDPSAVPNWKSALVSRLERSKRYPSDARARGEQGVVYLAFSVDRGGNIHGARITRSSGSSALDQETLSLASRASPVPAPPPEMGGSIPIVVPIRYNMR